MRKLVIALSVTFVVLVATGVYQAFRYLPGPQPFVATVHRWSAYLLLALLLATAVAHATRAAGARASSSVNIVLAAIAVATVAAIVTGPMLQWDQLALWAVTVGNEHIDGVFLSDSVKYILRGSQELGVSEFRRDVWLHVLVFPLVVAGGLGALWYAATRTSATAEVSEREEVTA